LQQGVCQKYGWGIEYGCCTNNNDNAITTSDNYDDDDDDDDEYWYVDIYWGIGKCDRFTAQKNEENSKLSEGKAIVSAIALFGLHSIIQQQEVKQMMTLEQVYPNQIPVYDSHSVSCWDTLFWNNPPSCVGIDTEGNQITPPVLVQISTNEYTILEVPLDGRLSDNLQRLLHDDSITKIFCDNFSHSDKKCLGLTVIDDDDEKKKKKKNRDDNNTDNNNNNNNKIGSSLYTKPPIIDIECMAMELLGPVKVARGLSRLVNLCLPEMNALRIDKPKKSSMRLFQNIGVYSLIEQGKAEPLQGLSDLNTTQQQYAALDAWCTLQVYQRLLLAIDESKK